MAGKKAVIKIERDWGEPEKRSFWSLWAVLLVGALFAALVFYWIWKADGGMRGTSSGAELAGLERQLAFFKDQNAELEMRLAKIERAGAIDEGAAKALQKTVSEREEEIKKLKEELSFYKSIVDPKTSHKGLGLKDFVMEDTPVVNRYKFKLVATQSSGKKAVRGSLVLRLQGHKDGKPVTLKWKELGRGKQVPKFKFQYFQKLEGAIVLPEGFEPEHIFVKLASSNGKIESVQQSYSWGSVFKVGEK